MSFEDNWMQGELLDMRLARAVTKAREVLTGWSNEGVVDLWRRFWAANHWLAANEDPEWFDALRILLWESVNPTLTQQGERPSQLAGGVFPGHGLMVGEDQLSAVRRYGSDDFISFHLVFCSQQAKKEQESQLENPFRWLTDQYGGPTLMGAAVLGEAAQAPRFDLKTDPPATGDPMQAASLHSRLENQQRSQTDRFLDEQQRKAQVTKEKLSEAGTKSSKERVPLSQFIAQLIREDTGLYELAHKSPSSAAKRILDTLPPDTDPRYFTPGLDEWACSSDGKKVIMDDTLGTYPPIEKSRSSLIQTYIPRARQIVDDERAVKVTAPA